MASNQLPRFRYHPDPIRTGYIEESDTECACCGEARGYVYTGQPNAEEDLEGELCPWCIADGSAAEEFDAEFADSHWLERDGISEEIIEEVTRRTPGFTAWQGDRWLTHCNDACEFHGDLPVERLSEVDAEGRAAILEQLPANWTWDTLPEFYEPGGQPGIYWFICRHCRKDLYFADHT